MQNPLLLRAQGCLLGQLSGDSLGSLVEFQRADQIRAAYPGGVRLLADGGTWDIIAGQPTDDSEMALALARTLVDKQAYDTAAVRQAYQGWLASGPFDSGNTTRNGLSGRSTIGSEANGALMRVSPLGIFCSRPEITHEQAIAWAMADAAQTHQSPICQQANALFVLAIADAVRNGTIPHELYQRVVAWATEMSVEPVVMDEIIAAAETPPDDFYSSQGWVLISLRNALWQMLHAPGLEEGIVDTVMHGGDADTNAAIAGAMLGALHGEESIPAQWRECVLNCRPEQGRPGVHQPRPEHYWPHDAMELAAKLVGVAE
jgi:ADP-ribosylglycohydrolase